MVSFNSLDEAYIYYAKLLVDAPSCAPRGMEVREVIGANFELLNIRNRLIYLEERNTSLFFHVGEFLWYIRGSDELEIIQYYSKMYPRFSDDQKTLYGAYGKRIFGQDELRESLWDNLVSLLRADPDSRQAVLSIHEPRDIYTKSKDIPCTCTLQFLVRQGRLYCVTYMRSNDLYLGLPYDVFCFTMLQEMLANELGLEVGTYRHFVGSLHIYKQNYEVIQRCSSASIKSAIAMPTMSRLDASQRQVLLEIEENLRLNKYITKEQFECLDSYWKQLVIILMHKAANFWGTTLSANITYLLDECYRKKLGIKGASRVIHES